MESMKLCVLANYKIEKIIYKTDYKPLNCLIAIKYKNYIKIKKLISKYMAKNKQNDDFKIVYVGYVKK